jgi:predicted ArsR family transcriptional regulator
MRRFSSGITTDEISNLFGKPPNAISGRLTELKKDGLIVATDRRRKTRTGRYARVFVVAGV